MRASAGAGPARPGRAGRLRQVGQERARRGDGGTGRRGREKRARMGSPTHPPTHPDPGARAPAGADPPERGGWCGCGARESSGLGRLPRRARVWPGARAGRPGAVISSRVSFPGRWEQGRHPGRGRGGGEPPPLAGLERPLGVRARGGALRWSWRDGEGDHGCAPRLGVLCPSHPPTPISSP